MRRHAMLATFVAGGVFIAAGLASCEGSSGRSGFVPADEEEPDPDVIDDTTLPDAKAPASLKIEAPAKNTILSDAYQPSLDVRLKLVDPGRRGFRSLTFSFESGNKDDPPVVLLQLPACGAQPCFDGAATESFVVHLPATKAVPYKKATLVVVGETNDNQEPKPRSAVQVNLDNDPPAIRAVDPTPAKGLRFIGDLVMHFRIDDMGGSGVRQAEVRLTAPDRGLDDERVWSFPKEAEDPAQPAVESVENGLPATVRTGGWESSSPVSIVVWARDAAGNEATTTIDATYVPTPYFAYNCLRTEKPEGLADVEPARVKGQNGVAAAGTKGVSFWAIEYQEGNDQPILRRVADLTTAPASKVVVVRAGGDPAAPEDLNADGLDDLVVLEPAATGAVVRAYLQEEDGKFDKGTAFAGSDGAVTFAVGRLNLDEWPDLAVAFETDEMSVGISLSEEAEDGGPAWRPIARYGGAPRPTQIAIGALEDLESDTRQVLAARAGSHVISVFQVTGDVVMGPHGSELKFDNPDLGALPAKVPATSISALLVDGVTPPKGHKGLVALFLESSRNSLLLANKPNAVNLPFSVHASLPTGLQPTRLAAGYLDGKDQILDVVVLSKGSKMVTVYWGTEYKDALSPPLYGLDEGSSHVTAADPIDVTLADMDRNPNGRPEIVVLDNNGTHMTVYAWETGASAHGFVNGPSLIRLADAPLALQAGQFLKPHTDGPGLLDLAVMVRDRAGVAGIRLIPARLDQEVPSAPPFVAGPDLILQNPAGMIARNFDVQGIDDLLVASNDVGPYNPPQGVDFRPTMQLFRFTKGGSHMQAVFTTTSFYAGDNPRLVAAGDLDAGSGTAMLGVPDLAVLSTVPKTGPTGKIDPSFGLSIFVGQPQAPNGWTFSRKSGLYDKEAGVDAARQPSGIAAGELGSGEKVKEYVGEDVVIAYNATNDFAVFYRKALGGFKPPDSNHNVGVGLAPRAIAVARMEGLEPTPQALPGEDPIADVLVLLSTDIALSRAFGEIGVPGDGIDFRPPIFLGYDTGRTGPFVPVAFAVRDMNADGYNDVVVLDQARQSVSLILNLGRDPDDAEAPPRFSPPLEWGVGAGPVALVVADLDGLGCPDIATLDDAGRSITIRKNYLCASTECPFK